MVFRNIREKRALLKFFYDSYSDNSRQSENRIEEIDLWFKPPINRDRLKLYLIEFLDKGWIEWDNTRSNAYIITDRGILYHSSWNSNHVDNQTIVIIGIITSAILTLLGFYLSHIGYI